MVVVVIVVAVAVVVIIVVVVVVDAAINMSTTPHLTHYISLFNFK